MHTNKPVLFVGVHARERYVHLHVHLMVAVFAVAIHITAVLLLLQLAADCYRWLPLRFLIESNS